MKKIYFIRHAKSEKNAINDFDRDINQRGKSDAKLMGKRLKKHSVQPDIIFSSTAKRSLKTAAIIAKEINFKKDIIQTDELYEASIQTLKDFISSLKNDLKNIFIIGHNPTLTEICEILSDSSIGNIPTCGIFCIEFKNFKEHGKAIFFDYPKKHKG